MATRVCFVADSLWRPPDELVGGATIAPREPRTPFVSASEVTTLWRYRSSIIIIIITAD